MKTNFIQISSLIILSALTAPIASACLGKDCPVYSWEYYPLTQEGRARMADRIEMDVHNKRMMARVNITPYVLSAEDKKRFETEKKILKVRQERVLKKFSEFVPAEQRPLTIREDYEFSAKVHSILNSSYVAQNDFLSSAMDTLVQEGFFSEVTEQAINNPLVRNEPGFGNWVVQTLRGLTRTHGLYEFQRLVKLFGPAGKNAEVWVQAVLENRALETELGYLFNGIENTKRFVPIIIRYTIEHPDQFENISSLLFLKMGSSKQQLQDLVRNGQIQNSEEELYIAQKIFPSIEVNSLPPEQRARLLDLRMRAMSHYIFSQAMTPKFIKETAAALLENAKIFAIEPYLDEYFGHLNSQSFQLLSDLAVNPEYGSILLQSLHQWSRTGAASYGWSSFDLFPEHLLRLYSRSNQSAEDFKVVKQMLTKHADFSNRQNYELKIAFEKKFGRYFTFSNPRPDQATTEDFNFDFYSKRSGMKICNEGLHSQTE